MIPSITSMKNAIYWGIFLCSEVKLGAKERIINSNLSIRSRLLRPVLPSAMSSGRMELVEAEDGLQGSTILPHI